MDKTMADNVRTTALGIQQDIRDALKVMRSGDGSSADLLEVVAVRVEMLAEALSVLAGLLEQESPSPSAEG